jgi:mRNA interferase MazF
MSIDIRQGDIVLIPFPYSDLQTTKTRPVVVISNNRLNQTADFIGIGISSKEKPELSFLRVSNDDLKTGKIYHQSFIYPHKIYLLEKNMIQKIVAEVKPEIIQKTLILLQQYF